MDAPGVQHKITLSDLPAPYASEPKASRSEVAKRPEGAELKTLPGFTAEIVASGLDGPRVIRFAPNGDLFLSESMGGRVRVLRFAPGQTAPVREEVFAAGLERPYGIAFYPPGPNPRYVYVATHGWCCAIPIEAASSSRPARPRPSPVCRPAPATGRAISPFRLMARRFTWRSARGPMSRKVRPPPRAEAEALEKARRARRPARNPVARWSPPSIPRARTAASTPRACAIAPA